MGGGVGGEGGWKGGRGRHLHEQLGERAADLQPRGAVGARLPRIRVWVRKEPAFQELGFGLGLGLGRG